MEDVFHRILGYLVDGLSAFSVLVLLWGAVLCAYQFFRCELGPGRRKRFRYALLPVKNNLGLYILLGLEILIAADIIETILNPTWQDLVRLGAIVTIRTVTAHFLNKEMQEGEELLANEKEAARELVVEPPLSPTRTRRSTDKK